MHNEVNPRLTFEGARVATAFFKSHSIARNALYLVEKNDESAGFGQEGQRRRVRVRKITLRSPASEI